MACGDFPYDCIADFAIDAALIALVVAIAYPLLALLFDAWKPGSVGGAMKAAMSVAGSALMGGAATALMMCASREMTDFLKEVIDEQLLLAEEYQAVFMQMFAKNPDFYEWGAHEESYAEACELGSVARARTPYLVKTSTEAYVAQKKRNRFQVGLGRRLFRDSAVAAGTLPAAMMATMANVEERMKVAVEWGNWERRISVLRTLGHVPKLSGAYKTAMESYAGMGETTGNLSGYFARATGAAIRLALEPPATKLDTNAGGAGPELFRLPQEQTQTSQVDTSVPELLRQPTPGNFGDINVSLGNVLQPNNATLPAPPVDQTLLGPDI